MSRQKQNASANHRTAEQPEEFAALAVKWACGVCVLALSCGPLYAAGPDLQADPWQIRWMPYFYFPSASADLDIGGLSGPVNLSSAEVVEYLDFASMGRIEAWQGDWGLFFDGIFMNLTIPAEFASPSAGGMVDAVLNERVGRADFALICRLIELDFGTGSGRRMTIEPYAGLRYAYLKQKVDLNITVNGVTALTRGRSQDWVEPFVGGRVNWDLNRAVGVSVMADMAGFGIGSASDFSWQIIGQMNYRLSERTVLNVGYRMIDIDYHRGSGPDELGIDVRAKGPFLGLTFTF